MLGPLEWIVLLGFVLGGALAVGALVLAFRDGRRPPSDASRTPRNGLDEHP